MPFGGQTLSLWPTSHGLTGARSGKHHTLLSPSNIETSLECAESSECLSIWHNPKPGSLVASEALFTVHFNVYK